MTKKLLALPVIAALCLALAGCGGLANSTQAAAYPDDKLIAQRGDTYTAVQWTGNPPDEMSVGEFTGTRAWLRLSVPEGGGELAIDYDQAVTAGDFKTVLAKYDERVEVVCEGTDAGARTFALEPGDYAVKAVGLKAAARLATQIRASEGVTAMLPGDALDGDEPVTLEPLAA